MATPPVEQTKERRSRDEHQPARGLWHWSRLWIERVCSHKKYFLAVVETVSIGIRVEGVGSDGCLVDVEERDRIKKRTMRKRKKEYLAAKAA